MNYKTIQHREHELLLGNSRKTPKDLNGDDSCDVLNETPRKRAEKEKLLNNTDPEDTTSQQKHFEDKSTVSSDPNQNTGYGSYLRRDLSEIQDLYNSNNTTSKEWVSFEESNSSQHTASDDVVAPKQNPSSAVTDNGDPGTLLDETDWIQFENTAVNNGSNGLNSKEPIVHYSSKKCESQGPEGNLQPEDASTNPFNNSELDQISSFSKPAKNLNGISSKSSPLKDTTTSTKSKPKETSLKNDRATVSESDENDLNSPLPAYPVKPTSTTWPMLLRYPDIKRRIKGREWRPVIVKLSGSILQLFHEHDTSAPFREVSLQCFYDLTRPQLQNYHGNKVHTVKILYVKFKETNKLLSKKNVQYIAKTTPILKLASPSHAVVQEFIDVVRHSIRFLPIFRDRGISHNTEAVYINVHDTCSAVIDANGSVVMLGILVRIYMRAFITGNAECELVLNDIHMKTQEEARLREELMPQRVHKWIKLEECDFHSTVNSSTYNQNRCIMLQPLDSCTFEVMQFRVRPAKPLPLLVKCELVTDTHGQVELRAEVKLCDDTKLAKYERKNICLYFPIPDTWAPLFMMEKRFGGEKSITSTNSQKAIKMRNQKNRPLTTIEVSTGSAKYEPEYKSIVWRINSLPLLNTTAPADSTHDFKCHIQSMSSSTLPDDYKPTCVMEYEIPYTVASDTNVVNFKVLDKKIATREVSYHTYYTYEIQLNITSLGDMYSDR